MSYAEAKEIAILRQHLRRCWDSSDAAGAARWLATFTVAAGTDGELAAEARRWAARFA